MTESVVGRILWLAVEDAAFRRRLVANLGAALAEEGFILSDSDMQTMRQYHDIFEVTTDDRKAFEKINAMARSYYR